MRAKPFSGKKKKQQLQEKRQRKQVNDDGEHFSDIEVALEIGNEKPLYNGFLKYLYSSS